MTTEETRRVVGPTEVADSHPYDHDSVARDLLSSAKDLCERALIAFTEEDVRAFYLNSGFSLEHALKAVLASVNPALIADPRHFESMLMLSRGSVNVHSVAPYVRTIALGQCLEKAGRIVAGIRTLRERLGPLVQHRNAVAHVGTTSSTTMDEDVKYYLSALTEISRHLGLGDPAYFFGPFVDFATAQLDNRAAADSRTLAGLSAAARIRFQERYPQGVMSTDLDAALHGRYWESGHEFQPYDCPICETSAVMIGDVGVDVDVDVDVSDGETMYHATAFVEFTPTAFECDACGLYLAESLLATAGFPESWTLDDVDPETVSGAYDDGYDAHYGPGY